MHFDGAHLLGNVLARALYQPLAQVGGELRPGIGGDVDATAERTAHVGGNLPDGVHLHRVGDEYAGLPVRVIDLQLHRDNRTVVFQRGDFDAEPFTLNLGCADHHRITWDDPLSHRHRLQQPQPDRLPVRHALRPIDTCRYGVPVRYGCNAHRRVETAVAFLREGSDKFGIAHGLSERGHHLMRHLPDGFCRVLSGFLHGGRLCGLSRCRLRG